MTVSLFRGDFARLWWGGLISMTGSWMLATALPAHVYLTTKSVPAASAMFLAGLLPRVLLGSLGGVVADRFDRRRLLALLNVLAALSLLPLLAVQGGTLWPVYVVAALETLVLLPTGPAENALLPSLAGSSSLARANALNALNNNLARLIGPALGGAVLWLGSLWAVVIIDAASYLLAALLIAGMRFRDVPRVAGETVRQAWRAGLGLVWRSRPLRLLVVTLMIGAVGEGVFGVLLAPFVTDVLGGDSRAYGLVVSAQAIGGLLGGVVMSRFADRWSPGTLLLLGTLGLGVTDLLIFLYPLWVPVVPPALALMILAGVPASAAGAGWATLVQLHAADATRGRAFGVAAQWSALCLLLGVGVANLARTPELIQAVIATHAGTLLLSALLLGVLGRRSGLFTAPAPAGAAEAG